VSRIYLDYVPSIQASWVTQGLKLGQVALAFGANDMGATMSEENVAAAAPGVRNQGDVDEMVRLVRAAAIRAAATPSRAAVGLPPRDAPHPRCARARPAVASARSS
jgi:2-iminoacetate synthase ThiH